MVETPSKLVTVIMIINGDYFANFPYYRVFSNTDIIIIISIILIITLYSLNERANKIFNLCYNNLAFNTSDITMVSNKLVDL